MSNALCFGSLVSELVKMHEMLSRWYKSLRLLPSDLLGAACGETGRTAADAARASVAGLLELPLSTSWQPGTSFMAWTADRWGI